MKHFFIELSYGITNTSREYFIKHCGIREIDRYISLGAVFYKNKKITSIEDIDLNKQKIIGKDLIGYSGSTIDSTSIRRIWEEDWIDEKARYIEVGGKIFKFKNLWAEPGNGYDNWFVHRPKDRDDEYIAIGWFENIGFMSSPTNIGYRFKDIRQIWLEEYE